VKIWTRVWCLVFDPYCRYRKHWKNRRFRPHSLVWRLLSREPREYLHEPILSQTESTSGIHSCHWQYGLVFIIFTQLFSKSTQKNSKRTSAKTEFNVKWPFKITENRRFRLPYCRLTPPLQRTREYPHKPYIDRNQSYCAASSLLTAWVYLHSNFRGIGSEVRVYFETKWVMAFKVIKGRWFRYQSKARRQLPISDQ